MTPHAKTAMPDSQLYPLINNVEEIVVFLGSLKVFDSHNSLLLRTFI